MLPKFSIAASRFTITFLRRHPPRAVRQIDADDRRQKLRRQPDRERERKQKRIEDRFVEINIEGEDRQDEQKGDLPEEISEAPDAVFEFGFRRAQSSAVRKLCRSSRDRRSRRRPVRFRSRRACP